MTFLLLRGQHLTPVSPLPAPPPLPGPAADPAGQRDGHDEQPLARDN